MIVRRRQTGTISRVETGHHPNTQLGTLGAIANALGCSVDDLVTWHIDLDWEAS
jgi:DNA-binding Xre family transcriptional regulator